MPRRQPLPRIWLMTDEREPDVLGAIARLPRQSGIIFRHYATPQLERRALFRAVLKAARRYRHVVLLAGEPGQAGQWGADGAHDRSARASMGLRTMAVHSAKERALAVRTAADLIFVSPIYPTSSHPGRRALGAVRMGMVAGPRRARTIALGGMTQQRFRALHAFGLYGWAGIDAFSTPKRQNLNAVPI